MLTYLCNMSFTFTDSYISTGSSFKSYLCFCPVAGMSSKQGASRWRGDQEVTRAETDPGGEVCFGGHRI